MEAVQTPSKAALWTGRILTYILTLFLLFDATMKIIKEAHTIQGSTQLGWPESAIQPLGFVLLICTILYVIPRTAILGAILLTAYLGGAVAIMARAGQDGHPYIFPVIFGVIVWAALYLRDKKLRSMVPLKQ
jgi:hypothetical protein